MSTAQPSPAFSAESSSGQSSENVSLRVSLLPYREWWAFLQSSPNPFREEPNDECTDCDAPATPIHKPSHNSHRASSLFSFTHKNPPRSSRVFEAPDDNALTPPSLAGSDLTITPSRYNFTQTMAEESKASFQEPYSAYSRDLGLEKEAEDISVSKNKGKPCSTSS